MRSRRHATPRRRYELAIVRDAIALLAALWIVVVLWAAGGPS